MVVNIHYHPVCEFDAGYVRSNTYQRAPGIKTAVGYLWISTASVTSQWEYKYELLPPFGTHLNQASIHLKSARLSSFLAISPISSLFKRL